ncbi:MAG: hypothetical protein ACHREM_26835 [Polyangiales bacterium]
MVASEVVDPSLPDADVPDWTGARVAPVLAQPEATSATLMKLATIAERTETSATWFEVRATWFMVMSSMTTPSAARVPRCRCDETACFYDDRASIDTPRRCGATVSIGSTLSSSA